MDELPFCPEIFRNLPDLYIFFGKFVFIFYWRSVSDLNPTLSRQRHALGLASGSIGKPRCLLGEGRGGRQVSLNGARLICCGAVHTVSRIICRRNVQQNANEALMKHLHATDINPDRHADGKI